MILPVNALTPKAYVGESVSSGSMPINKATERKIAIMNCTGVSAVTGAVTTAIVRTHTETWKQASFCGIGAAAVMMLFICPKILKKTNQNFFSGQKSYNA